MKPVSVAVLSDLHVGSLARAQDLCPGPPNKNLEPGYKAKFLGFLRRYQITADYLVVPGDVSHKAEPPEFKLASELIIEVAERLRVPQKRILFVPGNHDVDWSVFLSPDSTGFRRTQKYAPLNHHEWVFHKIIKRGKPGVLDSPNFCIWEFDDALAVGYNSSWDDDSEKAVHHGTISNEHLSELESQLAKIDLSSSRLRVFVVHHHPIQYSDPVTDPPDFSIMTNAENLLKTLRRYNFDLVVHGHKHRPNLAAYARSGSAPLVILCAGSFSAQLDTRWSGVVNNQFHVIHVEGRDEHLRNIYGRVESWTYLCASGWIPSKEHNGIRHVEPFGTYLQKEELQKLTRPIVEAELREHRYIEWATLVRRLPQLQYVRLDQATPMLDGIAMELHCQRLGDSFEHLILVRRGE